MYKMLLRFTGILIFAVFITLYKPYTLAQENSGLKLRNFYPSTPVPTDTQTPTPTAVQFSTPVPSDIPALSPSIIQPSSIFSSGFIYFSQRDARWRLYNPATAGQLGQCGCGETSAAMVTATLYDKSGDPANGNYNPKSMWDLYESYYPGHCGTALNYHTNMLAKMNLVSSVHGYDQNNPDGSNQVMANYLKNGYNIIILYGRSWTPIQHYVVLSEVIGKTIMVYDPYFLPAAKEPREIETGARINAFITVRI